MRSAILLAGIITLLTGQTQSTGVPFANTVGLQTTPAELDVFRGLSGSAPYSTSLSQLRDDALVLRDAWPHDLVAGAWDSVSNRCQPVSGYTGDDIRQIASDIFALALTGYLNTDTTYYTAARTRLVQFQGLLDFEPTDLSGANECILDLSSAAPQLVEAALLLGQAGWNGWTNLDRTNLATWLTTEVIPITSWATSNRKNNWGVLSLGAGISIAYYAKGGIATFSDYVPTVWTPTAYLANADEFLAAQLSKTSSPMDSDCSTASQPYGVQSAGGSSDDLRRSPPAGGTANCGQTTIAYACPLGPTQCPATGAWFYQNKTTSAFARIAEQLRRIDGTTTRGFDVASHGGSNQTLLDMGLFTVGSSGTYAISKFTQAIRYILAEHYNSSLVRNAPSLIAETVDARGGLDVSWTAITHAPGVSASTWFVSPTGSNSNPGTQALPWLTITYAVSRIAAGDTLYLETGTYSEQVTLSQSGIAGAPIAIRESAGATAVIDGTGVAGVDANEALFQVAGQDYITLSGFEVRDSAYDGINVLGESHHVTIDGVTSTANGRSGVYLDGPVSVAAHTSVINSTFTTNTRGGITLWKSAGGYFKIEGNTVSGNTGTGNYDGIQIGGGDGGTHHVVVRQNTITNNGASDAGEDNLDLGGHGINHHYLVEQNNISGTIGSFKLHSGSLADATYTAGTSGFHLARFNRITGHGITSYGYPNPIALYNNTLYDCGECFLIYGQTATLQTLGDSTYTSGSDAGRFAAKNNLTFQNAVSGNYVMLTAGPGTFDLGYDSIRQQNNLYRLDSGQRIAWTSIFGPPVDATAFASYKTSNSPDMPDTGSLLSTVSSATMFSDSTFDNYCLQPASPATNVAGALTTAVGSGTGSTTLIVDRASFFVDGYCSGGECLTSPDTIVIGATAAVAIVSINDATNTITLGASRTWINGDAVTLSSLSLDPDIGGGVCN